MRAFLKASSVAICSCAHWGIAASPAALAQVDQCQHGASITIIAIAMEAKEVPLLVGMVNGTPVATKSNVDGVYITVPPSYSTDLINFSVPNATCLASVKINHETLEVERVFNIFPASSDHRFSQFVGLVVPKSAFSLDKLKEILRSTSTFTVSVN
jgi:hypothetical protein